MIFDLHGEALVGGIERRAFGDGPRFQNAFHLEAEVIMKAGSVVPLHDKAMAFAFIELRWRLGRFRERRLRLYSSRATVEIVIGPSGDRVILRSQNSEPTVSSWWTELRNEV